jgi:hypothetical protein
MTDALWTLAQWFAAAPSRIGGCLLLCIVVGVFGGYATRKRRKR